jgi:hypothetical protein
MTQNFKNGKIYKITSGDKVYIGSTVQTLEKRFEQHKHDCEQYNLGKSKYYTSFEVINLGNAKITKIEDYKCNTIDDLQKREAEIIKSSECVNKTFKGDK